MRLICYRKRFVSDCLFGFSVKIMESLENARKRGANIIAEYLGGAITCDAHHMTDPRADGLGVSSCIQKALHDAGVSPEEVMQILFSIFFFFFYFLPDTEKNIGTWILN